MGSTLKFRGIRLENWRNFKHIDIPIQDRMFLVGANASGKSNLLDVFRFLGELGQGEGLQRAAAKRRGVKALRSWSARKNPIIKISVNLEDEQQKNHWTYELEFGEKEALPEVIAERVIHNGKYILKRPDADDKNDPIRLSVTHLENYISNLEFRELANSLANVRYLHLVPQFIREQSRIDKLPSDPFGSDFLEQVASTDAKVRNERLNYIGRALTLVGTPIEKIELKRGNSNRPHIRAKFSNWRPNGIWMEEVEGELSDGSLRLMGLLWAMMEETGLMLIEEPELSLHPEIIRKIPQLLVRAQTTNGRQILISTHSPEILYDEGIGLDEILLFIPTDDDTFVSPASSDDQAKLLLESGLPLADVVLPRTAPTTAGQLNFLLA